MLNIDEVWKRIEAHEGEEFETKTGQSLSYEIVGKIFYPSRTKHQIHKNEFRKALEYVPIEGPGEISDLVQGPSYIWAILHDSKIRKGEW